MRIKYILNGPLRNSEPAPGGGGEPAPLAPILDDNLAFAEGYQDRVGEFAKDSTFKNLPDLFKSQQEATATIRTLNQEKATWAQQLEEAKTAYAPPVIPASVEEFSSALTPLTGADLPEGVEIPQELVNKASEFAIKEGISPEIVSKFINFQVEQAGHEFQTEAAAHQAAIQQTTVAVKEAVGEQNYDVTIANAKAASEALGLQLSEESLASSPNMILALANIKNQISAGALKGASLGDPAANIVAGSKLEQANDIVSNPNNPLYEAYKDNSHPQHEVALNTRTRLISESAQA